MPYLCAGPHGMMLSGKVVAWFDHNLQTFFEPLDFSQTMRQYGRTFLGLLEED